MLLLEANQIEKRFGERLLFSIEQLRIHGQDRIGLIGLNGVGKSMLLQILAGNEPIDQGTITRETSIALIQQLGEGDESQYSGGEQTIQRIRQAMQQNPGILLADEPTANLDLDHVEWLERELDQFNGAVVVVSHDRAFLDQICTEIWAIEGRKIKTYKGNYGQYQLQKEQEDAKQQLAYELYQKKKLQLEQAIQQKEQKAVKMVKPPTKRMSTSETRAWKMHKGVQQKNMHRSIKALGTRIEKLEKVEQPESLPTVKLNVPHDRLLKNRTLLRIENLPGKIGGKVLWSEANFAIRNGKKVALIGKNGCGKTTFIRKILEQVDGVQLAPSVKIGYFSQQLTILSEEDTILENVKQTSVQPDEMIRTVLARLLFRGDEVLKKVKVLSGGERVKVAFAKIFLSDMNFLLLDEPTNYLDITTLEAFESLLTGYQGTVLFVSHDRQFVQNVAEQIVHIDQQQVHFFDGTYQAYQLSKVEKKYDSAAEELLTIDLRITELLAKLNERPTAELEAEFQSLIKRKKLLQ
ncbi:pleuromutilin/lincosamide/streptogramin A transport system ATP-binding/permease protein [Seinonella peptonophila]|uniref:Pleuromutilin/lincosamide/streptogramin A transport system ATP-binding/permease protein n=1 Tax=Seinonella peptonophila TaxID=112248 RepID=A0A1M4VI89_9BACL|nr:ABC-F type ribosomal protection protein [Seinonella peptonophila]SHE68572.1 pleuromutilin/lincosamide/streptogramin A transport system ATP-binding/permease protein [Seinonella peptonophila]